MKVINDWRLVLVACFTLGLAPFTPEPHIIANMRWVLGGAAGMELINWLDLAMHGLPWILLIRLIIVRAGNRLIKPA